MERSRIATLVPAHLCRLQRSVRLTQIVSSVLLDSFLRLTLSDPKMVLRLVAQRRAHIDLAIDDLQTPGASSR